MNEEDAEKLRRLAEEEDIYRKACEELLKPGEPLPDDFQKRISAVMARIKMLRDCERRLERSINERLDRGLFRHP